MCLILLAYKIDPSRPLVVLANRDEFYARPTRSAHWWEDHPDILAGRDLKAGGTWLGIDKSGRFCALTNYRDPANMRTDAISRGNIVSNYLRHNLSFRTYVQNFLMDPSQYNGFNLMAYEEGQLFYFSSKNNGYEALSPGIYGLSNALIDDPWPKVVKGKEKLNRWMENGADIEQAFQVMKDPLNAADEQLPETGVGLEMERALSPMYIQLESYGSRSSNVVVFNESHIDFYERDNRNEANAYFKIDLL